MKKSLKFVLCGFAFVACLESCLLVAHAGNVGSFFGYRGDTPSLPTAEEQFPEVFDQEVKMEFGGDPLSRKNSLVSDGFENSLVSDSIEGSIVPDDTADFLASGGTENSYAEVPDNGENNINFIPQLDPDTKHMPRRVGIVQIVLARRVVRERELQLRVDQAAQQVWDDDFKEPEASFFTKALCFLRLQEVKVPKLPSKEAKKTRVIFEEVFPSDLRMIILNYVDNAGELSTLSSLYDAEPEVKNQQDKRRLLRDYQLRKLRPFLPEFKVVPAVTQDDLDYLHGKLKERWEGKGDWKEHTSIHQPMSQFRVAEFKNCVGLCKIVTGFYPYLSKVRELYDYQRAGIIQMWNRNPFLPMVYLNVFEEDVIVKMLRKMTGRKTLSMTSPARNEASRRGRNKEGQIEAATYYFGEGDIKELQRHTILNDYSPYWGTQYIQADSVNEAPEGRTIEEFTNSLGLVHCIGLAYERSPIRDKNGKIVDADVRGGAFILDFWNAGSSRAFRGHAGGRYGGITSRLAEDDVPTVLLPSCAWPCF